MNLNKIRTGHTFLRIGCHVTWWLPWEGRYVLEVQGVATARQGNSHALARDIDFLIDPASGLSHLYFAASAPSHAGGDRYLSALALGDSEVALWAVE